WARLSRGSAVPRGEVARRRRPVNARGREDRNQPHRAAGAEAVHPLGGPWPGLATSAAPNSHQTSHPVGSELGRGQGGDFAVKSAFDRSTTAMGNPCDILMFGTGSFAQRIACDLVATAAAPTRLTLAGRNGLRLDWIATAARARAHMFDRPVAVASRRI